MKNIPESFNEKIPGSEDDLKSGRAYAAVNKINPGEDMGGEVGERSLNTILDRDNISMDHEEVAAYQGMPEAKLVEKWHHEKEEKENLEITKEQKLRKLEYQLAQETDPGKRLILQGQITITKGMKNMQGSLKEISQDRIDTLTENFDKKIENN